MSLVSSNIIAYSNYVHSYWKRMLVIVNIALFQGPEIKGLDYICADVCCRSKTHFSENFSDCMKSSLMLYILAVCMLIKRIL